MSAKKLEKPSRWLAGLAAGLREDFATPQPVEGVAGGALWLSLRVGGRFLWLVCANDLRAAWWTGEPAPRDWLVILQRHRDSPFARGLRGRRLAGAVALQSEESMLDGLRLDLAGGGSLGLRFFPRPGALWLESAGGEITAQQGRMDGAALDAAPDDGADLDMPRHAAACERALRALLDDRLARWLRGEIVREEKKRTRRLLAQESDLARAEARLDLRAKADLLAAHLHAVQPGQNAVVLEDFDGQSRSVPLDPKLSPGANLKALYQQAAKAERTVATLRERLAELRGRNTGELSPLERLDETQSLEERIEFARACGIPLAPAAGESRRQTRTAERLPYRSYRLPGGEELRVGRSAKDNDSLLRRHSAGKDLWLHAQGVEGSHVILRAGDREPSHALIEAAARVAAAFSKAKHSALVPVLFTERRYVRKPRKSAAGAVVAERGKTIFVEPGIPDGCVRNEPD